MKKLFCILLVVLLTGCGIPFTKIDMSLYQNDYLECEWEADRVAGYYKGGPHAEQLIKCMEKRGYNTHREYVEML